MKSILLHVHDDDGLEARMQAAFDLARAFGGHITCLHATPYEDYLAADPLIVAALPVEFSRKMARQREALHARIDTRMRQELLSWDWIHVDAQMSTALIQHSTLSDVVVLSLGPPALLKHDPRPLAASVATKAAVPVLGVPAMLRALRLDKPALVAWNGSAEAAAALRAALPLLQAAPEVHLLEVQERLHIFPSASAARYLSRHGVGVDIHQRPALDGHVSRAIEQAAMELDAGIVVMGAYGHTRLREHFLGGVTRDLTQSSRLPLLLAH